MPRSRRVIELARELSRDFNRNRADSIHLLLGILQEAKEADGGIATHILTDKYGIDLSGFEQQLKLAMITKSNSG